MNYITYPTVPATKYFLVIRQDYKERLVQVSESLAREARKFKDRQGYYANSSFFDLHDKNGNYKESFDRNEFKGIRTEKYQESKDPTKKGYYCPWGVWHSIGSECKHLTLTGVPPQYMQEKKRELFPDWQDGMNGRPEKHIRTNAMTQEMQNAIVMRYKLEHALD